MLARPLSLFFSTGSTPAARSQPDHTSLVLTRPADFGVARGWFALSIASLVVAGLLSLALVVGRIPVISDWIADPLFFKRCLVVHVVLALVVWFHASAGAWISLLSTDRSHHPAGRAALWAAATGVALITFSGAMRGSTPILSNYVPVVEHPLFLVGLACFFGGTALCFGTALHAPGTHLLPAATATGLRASAVAFCAALIAFFAALRGLPAGLPAATFYEFLFWGGGHVLQVANVCALLALWLFLLHRSTGRPALSARTAVFCFAALVTPHLAAPLFALGGTMTRLYHDSATELMRWGIFPAVLVVTGFCVRHAWRHDLLRDRLRRHDPLVVGFLGSVGLTLLGFVIGATIRRTDTVIPGHYHASIGAVTLAFMAGAYEFTRMVGAPGAWRPSAWLARTQLALFAIGQSVFALGFALAGHFGAGRKTYANEQQVRSLGELTGLGFMSLGGLIAVVSGVLFLVAMVRQIAAWRQAGPPLSTP
ncbi:MAG: cbb3-type cytochrome c oxidase subunit I [Verrucomicrobia bacterium]|nr:cbb3-type cytochrome c oxidase subunit I [Verrucomicrobiota bacterium]